jgi:hypothetical protein
LIRLSEGSIEETRRSIRGVGRGELRTETDNGDKQMAKKPVPFIKISSQDPSHLGAFPRSPRVLDLFREETGAGSTRAVSLPMAPISCSMAMNTV